MADESMVGQYAVLENWRYEVVQITKETAALAWYSPTFGSSDRRVSKDKLLAFGPDQAVMQKLAERLTSARAECGRREGAARAWFGAESRRLIDAAGRGRGGVGHG